MVQYIRVQMIVAFIDAVGIGAGAAIIGVPLALPLGVLVFLGSFIPIIGAWPPAPSQCCWPWWPTGGPPR